MADPGLEHDRAQLVAFRAGDSAVLERVYYALVDDVFRIAALGFTSGTARVGAERDPAEQRAIVQDVFVRAFAPRARDAYDGLRPYRPYLLTLARNVMVDRARVRARESARTVDLDLDALIAADEPLTHVPEDAAEVHELRGHTSAYIATLDAEQRELVRLRFEGDCSQLDCATAMGVSRRRVRTLEARLLKGLIRFLKKHRPAGTVPP